MFCFVIVSFTEYRTGNNTGIRSSSLSRNKKNSSLSSPSNLFSMTQATNGRGLSKNASHDQLLKTFNGSSNTNRVSMRSRPRSAPKSKQALHKFGNRSSLTGASGKVTRPRSNSAKPNKNYNVQFRRVRNGWQ